MNKKLKKMIAVVSAVATCAVSMVSMTSGAIYIRNTAGITPYTVSFTMNDVKYGVWQEMNDYFNNNEDYRFFISENGEHHMAFINNYVHSLWYWGGYAFDDDDENISVFEKYLSDNNIKYEKRDIPSCNSDTDPWWDGVIISIPQTETVERYEDGFVVEDSEKLYTDDEYFKLLQKIKEETGFKQGLIIPLGMVSIDVTDVEIELPEPTLMGDTNCDGEVNISDAVLLMQSITNPSEFQVSIQGIANADVTGDDGITLLDALRIQEMQVGR